MAFDYSHYCGILVARQDKGAHHNLELAPRPRSAGRTSPAAKHHAKQKEDANETRGQGRHHLRRGLRHGGGHGAHVRARRRQGARW
jgi:hypothetical protein